MGSVGESISSGVGRLYNQANNATGGHLDTISQISGGFNPYSLPGLAETAGHQQLAIEAAEEEEKAAKRRSEQSQGQVLSLADAQKEYAASLKRNAVRDQGLLLNQAAGNEKRALAERMVGIKQGASSRGLIGSGFQKYSEAGETAKSKASLAEKQSKISELSRQQIQDAQDLELSLRLEAAGAQQNQSDKYYQIAVQNLQNRNQAYRDILNAGAEVGGTYLAHQNGGAS